MAKQYDSAYKIEVCRRLVECSESVAVVARELDINENMLHTWKQRYKESGAQGFPGSGHLRPEDAELKRLQRENRELREENDILKRWRLTSRSTKSRALWVYPSQPPRIPGE